MTLGRAHYVRAKQIAFPYGERWASGPFESLDEAAAECARLRPLYPDAVLSVATRTGKSLPPVAPRAHPVSAATVEGYNLRNRTGREAAAAAIVAHVEALGLACEVENWNGEPDVTAISPSLRAGIWLAFTPAAPMLIIDWYGAALPLRGVPGAWPASFNHWRTKATSIPRDWPELFAMLEIGLLAAVDGSAFDLET